MIGTLDLGFPIRLEGIVYDHAKFASYEPELFPGLIYRCLSPKVVLLIFVSGKVVITGAKDEGDMARVMEKMRYRQKSLLLILDFSRYRYALCTPKRC